AGARIGADQGDGHKMCHGPANATKFENAHSWLEKRDAMATFTPHLESAAERLARFQKRSEEATETAIAAQDFRLAQGYLRIAREWDELAAEVAGEVKRKS
ncbi:MAG TPA: hypothetical protein VKB67_14665, partial [Rhizomicrobium sp.]|nr:hypothetical protein [Rhizomicrobium sp.]